MPFLCLFSIIHLKIDDFLEKLKYLCIKYAYKHTDAAHGFQKRQGKILPLCEKKQMWHLTSSKKCEAPPKQKKRVASCHAHKEA